jgi:hypothetical protein
MQAWTHEMDRLRDHEKALIEVRDTTLNAYHVSLLPHISRLLCPPFVCLLVNHLLLALSPAAVL